MSSNRTIIPGMESSYRNEGSNNDGRSSYGSGSGAGTYVPSGVPNQMGEAVYGQSSQKPVIGFLYSISRSGAGEFWPLHIGSNTIGRSPKCDVCLQEGTVSENHATLVIRVMKNPEKVIASICDSSSTIGTMINGESLGFDQRECFNGDIITVGAHYDLFFILVDAKQIGLRVCGDFIPISSQGRSQTPPSFENTGMSPTVDMTRNPYEAPVGNSTKRTRGYEDPGMAQSGGTRGLPNDPSSNDEALQSGGRTIFM